MKKVTYIRHVSTFLVISILIISGCKGKKPADSNTVTTKMPGTSQRRQMDDLFKLPDPNEVAATVNGVEIHEAAVQEIIKPEIDRVKDALQNSTEPLPEEARVTQFMKEIWQDALMQLIREELLKEQVKDVNIVISNEEADEFFKKRLEQANVDWESFKIVMEERKVSYQEILDDVKKELIYIKYIVLKMDDSEKVTEEDAREFYDENQNRFTIPEQVKASHILVQVSEDDSNDVKQKAKEKIDDLLRQLKEGADFAELAKNNSDDPTSAPDGGDLDYFSRGMMVKEFEEPAFKLEPNQVSDVVETDYGYHIIKVTDHKEEEIVPFDEIKDMLTESLKNEKESQFINKYIESLIKEADIKFPKGKEIKFQFSE